MILTVADVKLLLVQVMELCTGLPPGRVIYSGDGDSGPRPSEGLYCSMWWKRLEPLPQTAGAYSAIGDDMLQEMRNESLCEVQVDFWGKKAFDTAAIAIQKLQADARFFDLWRVIGYGGIDAVQDISAYFQGTVQGRAFFTLSFYACFGSEYPVEWFDTSHWQILPNNDKQKEEQFDYSKEIADEPKSRCMS